jgi:hypothetical protein
VTRRRLLPAPVKVAPATLDALMAAVDWRAAEWLTRDGRVVSTEDLLAALPAEPESPK